MPNVFKRTISIAHSPNTEWDDVVEAIKSIFSFKYKSGIFEEEFRKALIKYFNVENVYLFESARSSQYVALKALGIGNGDEVIISSFNCVAVANAVIWTGATPIYTDVEKETLNMSVSDLEKKITDKTKAIIVQHTFGYPASIEGIAKTAKNQSIPLIEDCSHNIGSQIDGKMIGTFADISFFSIGRDKSFSAGFGGVLIVNDKKLAKKVDDIYSDLNYPSASWTFRELLYPIIVKGIIRPLYNFISLGKILLVIFQKIHLITFATSKDEKEKCDKPYHIQKKLPDALARIALKQFRKLNRFQKHRKELEELYKERLSPTYKLNYEGDYYLLRYPLIVKNPNKIRKVFNKKHGIVLGDWYNQVIAPSTVNLKSIQYKNDCPNAEWLSQHILNLPLNILTSKEDAEKIADILAQIL